MKYFKGIDSVRQRQSCRRGISHGGIRKAGDNLDISDERLAELIAGGDEAAFEELVRRFGTLIRSVVRFHLRDLAMWQDDCINDVLLRLWQNMDRFDPQRSTLKNWVGAVAKYRAVDYKRKYCGGLMSGELSDNIRDTGADIELMRQELREEIDSLLENLSAEDREIFIRYYLMDADVESIADKYGRSSAYIYNRLSRGRKKLKRLFWGGNYEKRI